jgi:hypothetical protein
MLKKRISHIKRIFSETNGGRVIERGLWPGSWVYIAIFEVPKEKVVIWNRYNKGDFEGLWDRYGEYKLEDYKNVREMFKDVQSDIRLGPGPSRHRFRESKSDIRERRRRRASRQGLSLLQDPSHRRRPKKLTRKRSAKPARFVKRR